MEEHGPLGPQLGLKEVGRLRRACLIFRPQLRNLENLSSQWIFIFAYFCLSFVFVVCISALNPWCSKYGDPKAMSP